MPDTRWPREWRVEADDEGPEVEALRAEVERLRWLLEFHGIRYDFDIDAFRQKWERFRARAALAERGGEG